MSGSLAKPSCPVPVQRPAEATTTPVAPSSPGEAAPAPPAIAVIVPVLGHAGLLPDLLGRLAAQTWRDFELLVIDNGTEPDPLIAEAVAGRPELRVRVLHCARPGSYVARNAGVAATAAEWLAFTDADCRPEPTWLEAMIAAARARPDCLLAGAIRVSTEPAPTLWAIFDTVRGIPQERYVRHGYGATANLFLRREVLRDVGGFNPERFSGGDAEFCRRAGARGHPVVFLESAVVTHPARATWTEVASKARRIKGGQLASGTRWQRACWFIRSLVPPFREIVIFLRSQHRWDWRFRASAVRLLLWIVEVTEVFRLVVLRARPERR